MTKPCTEYTLTARQLRSLLEEVSKTARYVGEEYPKSINKRPRKHETAFADGIRHTVRALLNTLELEHTWLERTQLQEREKLGYTNFCYDAQDGTFYFGYFKKLGQFVEAVYNETEEDGRNWIRTRVYNFDEEKYGVEAWVNLGELCKEEVPDD